MADNLLGSTTVTQIGMVVRDIEAKAQAWAALLGVPVPPIIVTDTFERAQTHYQGQPSQAQAKLAFFHLGQVDLELIEPIGGPSTWADQLANHGESLHHIAFVVQGLAGRLDGLAAQGLPEQQRGEYQGGRYVYVDGVERFGTVVELLENDR